MALNRTTLSAAVTVDDKQITVASLTGVAVGNIVLVNGEKMRVLAVPSAATLPVDVLRGIGGTTVTSHPVTSGVAVGLPEDFAKPLALPPREREMRSYSAAGAIALPRPGNDMVAVIIGTSALAMTLANPSVDQDGDLLIVVASGKAAHTLTYAAGVGEGGGTFDVGTFSATLQGGCILMAVRGFWVLIGNGIATATGATGAPLFT